MYYSESWKNIPEYKWTAADILYWRTFGGNKYLHSEKISYIKNYKKVILDAAKKYNLPPLLLAGVMYNEYGGDPMFIDDVAYGVRSFDWSGPDWVDKNYTITKNPDLTSFGNTSIQVRRAIEMLGYTTDTDKRDKIIASLKDPIQNIYMTACHLNVLRNVDFAGKNANDLTEDEIKITASRYNIGPEPEKNAIVTDYGQAIYDNKDDILKALK